MRVASNIFQTISGPPLAACLPSSKCLVIGFELSLIRLCLIRLRTSILPLLLGNRRVDQRFTPSTTLRPPESAPLSSSATLSRGREEARRRFPFESDRKIFGIYERGRRQMGDDALSPSTIEDRRRVYTVPLRSPLYVLPFDGGWTNPGDVVVLLYPFCVPGGRDRCRVNSSKLSQLSAIDVSQFYIEKSRQVYPSADFVLRCV